MSSEGASVLQEAYDLVGGARQEQYGDPVTCYRRVGEIWGMMLNREAIPADTVALMMVGLKLCREMNRHKRDNLLDACGYLEIADMANARR